MVKENSTRNKPETLIEKVNISINEAERLNKIFQYDNSELALKSIAVEINKALCNYLKYRIEYSGNMYPNTEDLTILNKQLLDIKQDIFEPEIKDNLHFIYIWDEDFKNHYGQEANPELIMKVFDAIQVMKQEGKFNLVDKSKLKIEGYYNYVVSPTENPEDKSTKIQGWG